MTRATPAPPIDFVDRFSPSTQEVSYSCPWCTSTIKKEKDFIRHVKEKCCPEAELRCPDCSKTYTRKHRLAKHHETHHRSRCGPGPCTHVDSATIRLANVAVLACGFCLQQFDSDLHGFLRHLIFHYRSGATLSSWRTGPHVPSASNERQISPPPQITLSGSLEGQGSMGDFSALRSGFGLQDDSPCRTYSAISDDSTLFDTRNTSPCQQFHTGEKFTWDPYFNPNNMAFVNPVPSAMDPQTQQHFFKQTTQHQNHDEEFSDMMKYLDQYPEFVNPSFIDPTGDKFIPQSEAVTSACAQLYTNMDINSAAEAPYPAKIPPFNPTTPLDLTKDRRRSMSERLLRKFQSLSPIRTEF